MLNTHTKIREFKLDNIEYLKALYDLMKPRVMSLAIFTCVVGFLIAPYKNVDYLYATLSIIAVALGTAANGFAKSAQGFTLLIPSVVTAITIVLCMYTLSLVMKVIPVGITYASFAGLCIVATVLVGVFKFNQTPNLYTIIGLGLIIAGVLMVNLIGETNN